MHFIHHVCSSPWLLFIMQVSHKHFSSFVLFIIRAPYHALSYKQSSSCAIFIMSARYHASSPSCVLPIRSVPHHALSFSSVLFVMSSSCAFLMINTPLQASSSLNELLIMRVLDHVQYSLCVILIIHAPLHARSSCALSIMCIFFFVRNLPLILLSVSKNDFGITAVSAVLFVFYMAFILSICASCLYNNVSQLFVFRNVG